MRVHRNNVPSNSGILSGLESNELGLQLQALCQYLGGVTVLLKGHQDLLSYGKEVFALPTYDEQVGLKRCGGLVR